MATTSNTETPNLTTPSQNAVSTPVATNQPVVNAVKPDFSQDALTPQANKSGLTPTQMSALAGSTGSTAQATNLATQEAATVAASQAYPGQVISGPQTGTIPAGQGLAPQPTTFQAYTSGGYDTSLYTSSQQSQEAAQFKALQDQRAIDAAKLQATQQQQANQYAGQQVAGYTDANGVFHAGTTVLPNPTPVPKATTGILTDNLKSTISGALSPSGVVTTDSMDAARGAVGSALDQLKATALANIPTVSDPNTQAYIDHNNQEAQRLQSLVNDPSLDPMQQQLVAKAALLAQEKADKEADIHKKAQKAYEDQEAANKEIVGKMRVALATGGVAGSPLGVSILAGVFQGNQRALNNIRSSEQDAINEAERAFREEDFNLASQKIELAEQRRQQFNDLQDKQFQISQQIKQQQQQDIAFKMQMDSMYRQNKREDRADIQAQFADFAKAGSSWDAIPQAAKIEAASIYGSEAAARGVYTGSLNDQKATTLEQFNKNTQAFYQTASLIKDPNTILMRPNPDGTFTSIKRSEVQLTPNYTTMQLQKDGRNKLVFIDPNNPDAPAIEKDMGEIPPNWVQGKTNPFTGDITYVNANDPRQTLNPTNYQGNPGGPESIANTSSFLEQSRYPYTDSSGAPTAAQTQFPDNSIHYRGSTPAYECGQFCNDILGTKFGDSLKDKISKTDKTIGTEKNPVKVGDAIVTSEAVGTGHVAIINSISYDENGNEVYTLSESNYRKNKNGQGIVTNDRTLPANSKLIKGYTRGPKNPFAEQAGPQVPADNGAAWIIKAPESVIKTHIQDGTVENYQEVGTDKSGSPMFEVQIRDNATNTVHIFSGIRSSELRIGASWNNSTGAPVIGQSSASGYTQEIRNTDGSPLMPTKANVTGNTLTTMVQNGQSWGRYNSLPMQSSPEGVRAAATYNKIIDRLGKGGLTLESALQQMKNDPLLGQVRPDTYLSEFQDASSLGEQARAYKNLQTQNLQEGIKQKQLREARTVVPAAQLNADPRIKNYRQQQALMPKIKAVETQLANNNWVGNAVQDLDLLDSYVRMSSGSAVTEAQVDAIKEYQAAIDKGRNLLAKGQFGGFLTPESRQQIVSLSHQLSGEQKSTFDEAIAEYQSMLQANGIDFNLQGVKDINSLTGSIISADGNSIPIGNQQMDFSYLDSIPAGGSINDPEFGQVIFSN